MTPEAKQIIEAIRSSDPNAANVLEREIGRLEVESSRLKVKCNQYAKRLVVLGDDAVVWERGN